MRTSPGAAHQVEESRVWRRRTCRHRSPLDHALSLSRPCGARRAHQCDDVGGPALGAPAWRDVARGLCLHPGLRAVEGSLADAGLSEERVDTHLIDLGGRDETELLASLGGTGPMRWTPLSVLNLVVRSEPGALLRSPDRRPGGRARQNRADRAEPSRSVGCHRRSRSHRSGALGGALHAADGAM